MTIIHKALSAALLGAAIAATGLGTKAAPEKPDPAAPIQQTFDDQLPGELPRGWSVLWGEQGDDLFAVSNLENGSTGNSALLDRQIGDNPKMYGVGRALPDIKSGWYAISFAFRAEGDGSNVSIGIEIRPRSNQPGTRPLTLGLDGLKVTASGPNRASETLGRYELRKWYRIAMRLPTAEGKQTTATAVLQRRDENGAWTPVSPPVTLPSAPPEAGYGTLMFSTHPNKRNYRVFLDDLVVEKAPDAPL